MIVALPQNHLSGSTNILHEPLSVPRDRCCSVTRKYDKQTQQCLISGTILTEVMDKSIQQDFENQFNDVVSRLQSKQMFQSDWDIASFAIFFIFIGMVLLLVILVLIRCCCCCCCDEKPRRQKVGIDNMGMEP
uniref:Si:ch1073-443f11.2 n=2 Tax=Danio rerio TaxID=7955 RepID=A0A0R4IAP1_DANRE|nr:small integral membrane protein 22 isoform X1 [Danio rerio]|eukprot:XP_021324900.1 small integral membrane protein 22 isoform X1 [Danio rerio]